MKYKLKKDKSQRKLINKENYIIYKSILKNRRISPSLRLLVSLKFQKFLKMSATTKSYRNCVESNDSRSVNRVFKLNSTVVKNKFEKGKLNGFKKSS